MTNDNLKMKGFTLIELLAVIVILAVIALIAVPRIIEILNKSRLSAAEDSTMGIVEAADSYVASFMLQNQGAIPSEDLKFSCSSSEGCILTNELTNYNTENLNKLEFKGKKPIGGAITISENGNKVTAYGLLINNFICNYGDGIADCIDSGDIGPTKGNPPSIQHEGVKAIVYLDPTDLTNKCTNENVNSDTGTKTGCMKWYAYAEDNNTYTMILDHNTTAIVAWNSKNDNKNSSEIMTKLKDDTEGWDKSLNPRLISTDEIIRITGKENWENKNWVIQDSNTNCFYFEDLSEYRFTSGPTKECVNKGNCKYAWLYDRTGLNCETVGCLNNAVNSALIGYWTSTPVGDSNERVWMVYRVGVLANYDSNTESEIGIRPVITISKSLISN